MHATSFQHCKINQWLFDDMHMMSLSSCFNVLFTVLIYPIQCEYLKKIWDNVKKYMVRTKWLMGWDQCFWKIVRLGGSPPLTFKTLVFYHHWRLDCDFFDTFFSGMHRERLSKSLVEIDCRYRNLFVGLLCAELLLQCA